MSYIYITQKFANGVSVGKIAVFFQLAFLRRELFFAFFFGCFKAAGRYVWLCTYVWYPGVCGRKVGGCVVHH